MKSIGTLCFLVLLSQSVRAVGPANVQIMRSWRGTVTSNTLQPFEQRQNFVEDEGALKRIWAAWGVAGQPRVDFEKYLVVVATAPGPNQVQMRLLRDDAGDVQMKVSSTKRGGPGFGYALAMIARKDIKSIAGVPIGVWPDSVAVTVVGVLRTGLSAIGGETTGTVIASKRITFEVDVVGNGDLAAAVRQNNGQRVMLSGELDKKLGVERGDRWIIRATAIERLGRSLRE